MVYLRKTPLSLFSVVALAGAFIFFSFFPVRLDLSKGAAYTLSPSTKKIIRTNSKNVDITVYVSSDIPTRIIPLRTDVLELLQEYRRGGKNIRVSIVDPKTDPKLADKLKQLGVPELQFSQLEQNKYQTSSFYFGIVLSQSDKNEVIPQVNDYANLEYNLTSAIYRLTRSDMPKVALVGESASGYGQQDALLNLKKILSQQYTVTSIDLTSLNLEDANKSLSNYATIILLDSGSNKYSSDHINLFKQFYDEGKNIIVFAGGTKIDERTLAIQEADHNLNELTATYGAHIDYDLVLSTSAEYVNFGNETSQFLAPYPFWIRSNIFDIKSGLFANIQFVTFPWTSSLSLKKMDGISMTPIIRSSTRSWAQKDTFLLNPNTIPQPTQKDLSEFVLGALLKNKNGGEMVVIPSSRFPLDQYLSRGGGNTDFILNTVDAISSSGALSGIRSRIVSFYPLPDMPDAQKDMDKYTALLLFPLIWAIYGAIRLIKRK